MFKKVLKMIVSYLVFTDLILQFAFLWLFSSALK